VDAKLTVELAAFALAAITVVSVIVHRVMVDKGIGIRAIQFAAVPVIPAFLVVLSVEHAIDMCVVATLLGVLVGYIFSKSAKTDDESQVKP
jgi:hypothetical protein